MLKRYRMGLLMLALLGSVLIMWGMLGSGLSPVVALAEPPFDGSYKTVSASSVAPGGHANYTIVLHNGHLTQTFSMFPVQDVLDTRLSIGNCGADVSVAPSGRAFWSCPTASQVDFTVGTIAPGEYITLSFSANLTVSAAVGAVITNVATINNATDTNIVSFTVAPAPAVQIRVPDANTLITARPGTAWQISGVAWDTSNPAPFPDAPVLNPINNFGANDYTVTWSAVSGASGYTWQQSTSPYFETLMDSGDTAVTFKSFTDQPVGTYYYRVKAIGTGTSRWSNIEAVTVTQTLVGLNASWRLAENGLPAMSPATAAPQIQIVVKQGATPVVTATVQATAQSNYWVWTYDWTLPEADMTQYTIWARAMDSGGNYGEYDQIPVWVDNGVNLLYLPIIMRRYPPVPYSPALTITKQDNYGNYTVSWTYNDGDTSVPDPSLYTLQQATDSAFTTGLVETAMGSSTSKVYTNQAAGTYYYRVRGTNAYGPGEWSNVGTVTALNPSYHDDFVSYSGWKIYRSDDGIIDPQDFIVSYMNGNLYTLLWGRYDFAVVSPLVTAPTTPPYTIRARVKVVNETIDGRVYAPKDGETYGIIFGGNGGTPCPADRNTPQNQGCLSHYYRLLMVWSATHPNSVQWQLKRIDYHVPGDTGGGKGEGVTLIDYNWVSGVNANDWNTWEVRVSQAGVISVYVNDRWLASATDSTYINGPYFGTFMASPEFGAVGYQWDWFEFKPQP